MGIATSWRQAGKRDLTLKEKSRKQQTAAIDLPIARFQIAFLVTVRSAVCHRH
jgi:hypothetical protein